MDRLFKLLREFPSNDAKVLDEEDSAIIDTWQEFVYWNRIYLYETIISKKFGFIKWLVDNDKINREWMKWHWRLISYCLYIKSWEWDKIKEWVLLMLLAIQDEPIEFLCNILK